MPLEPEEKKQIDGLGAAIAALGVEIESLKKRPTSEAQLTAMSVELETMKKEFQRMAGPGAAPSFWEGFWKDFFGAPAAPAAK